MMNERDVVAAIKKNRSTDKIRAEDETGAFGPYQVAQSVIWEVWVVDQDDRFATRFLEDFGDGTHAVYDSFGGLMVRLSRQNAEVLKRVKEEEWKHTVQLTELQSKNAAQAATISNERLTRVVMMLMAAGAFFFSLVILAYSVIWGGGWNATTSLYTLACVVASACVFVFGKFVSLDVSKLSEKRSRNTGADLPDQTKVGS